MFDMINTKRRISFAVFFVFSLYIFILKTNSHKLLVGQFVKIFHHQFAQAKQKKTQT